MTWNALAAVIPVGFFAAIAAAACYVDARLRASFGMTTMRRHRLFAAAAMMAVLAILGLTATSESNLAGFLYISAGHIFSFFLYLLLGLGVSHLLGSIPVLSRMMLGLAAVVIALGATVLGAMRASTFEVNIQEIALPGLRQEVKVMQLSDVHLGHHRGRDYLARIVDETNRHAPDIVIITGDLVDAHAALRPETFAPLANLRAPAYYVGGNHEETINLQRALDLIGANGVRILHNQSIITHGIELVGLDYMKADNRTFDIHPSKDTRTIQDVMRTMHLRHDIPTVVMQHSPVGIDHIAGAGADLVVAGHTHGGQLFPATLIARLIFPFNLGLSTHGKTWVFVSRGAGTFLQKNRLGSSNQIDLLILNGARRSD